ncbi:MAG TPA: amidohydrolase family protein [Caldilinea sp.]|nr:amidohydrolase family protein [Anaerolineales bacterium]HRA65253.1 amidohydrolase family protein [Caldilinea sp.]
MSTIRLPGLVDAHVHLREPGYEYKEDFTTGTMAALAGGVTTVLDMPNTTPPTSTPERLADKARRAAAQAVCDVGLFVGATNTEADAYLPVAAQACGLKIYVSDTFGSLRIDTLALMHRLFRTWAARAAQVGYRMAGAPHGLGPITVHAEELMLPVCLALSQLYAAPLHIAHVSRRSEIELIRAAKERGFPVTCEVTPHHLFLSTEDGARLGARGDMRPRLATPDDVAALWEHLVAVDIFATDHAPHTLAEKGIGGNAAASSPPPSSPPPGVPGLETMLPLLLTAAHKGLLELDDIIARCVKNPRRIYGLPEQPATWIEVDLDAVYTLENSGLKTKVGWTPFAGQRVHGRVERVVLRGEKVYEHGEVLASPGSGRVLFVESKDCSAGFA